MIALGISFGPKQCTPTSQEFAPVTLGPPILYKAWVCVARGMVGRTLVELLLEQPLLLTPAIQADL